MKYYLREDIFAVLIFVDQCTKYGYIYKTFFCEYLVICVQFVEFIFTDSYQKTKEKLKKLTQN